MTCTPLPCTQEGHRQATFWGGGLQYSVISNSSKTEPTIDKKRFVDLFCRLSPWKHMWQVEDQAELAFVVGQTTSIHTSTLAFTPVHTYQDLDTCIHTSTCIPGLGHLHSHQYIHTRTWTLAFTPVHTYQDLDACIHTSTCIPGLGYVQMQTYRRTSTHPSICTRKFLCIVWAMFE